MNKARRALLLRTIRDHRRGQKPHWRKERDLKTPEGRKVAEIWGYFRCARCGRH